MDELNFRQVGEVDHLKEHDVPYDRVVVGHSPIYIYKYKCPRCGKDIEEKYLHIHHCLECIEDLKQERIKKEREEMEAIFKDAIVIEVNGILFKNKGKTNAVFNQDVPFLTFEKDGKRFSIVESHYYQHSLRIEEES